MLELRKKCRFIYSWILTPIEGLSAIRRLERTRAISITQSENIIHEWKILCEGLYIIKDVPLVIQQAERVLGLHPLKAADALQLAASLVACNHDTSAHTFVTLDQQLKTAAKKEGFRVWPEGD